MSDKTTVNIKVTMKTRWVPHFLSMLKCMEALGSIGGSKRVSLFSDGDGDFRPKFEWDYEGEVNEKPSKSDDFDILFDAG